jgi:TPR repeat protein
VRRSPQDAIRLFTRACDAGHLLACSNLGSLYETASGTTRDARRAIDLYHRACTGGEPRGCFNLGRMYERGDIGTSPAPGLAIEHYRRACEQGYRPACEARTRLSGE